MSNCLLAAVVASVFLVGCQTDTSYREDGMTTGAGNAIAANTVLQMVDPWPRGVQQTNLIVPADLERYRQRQSGSSSVGYEGDNAGTAASF